MSCCSEGTNSLVRAILDVMGVPKGADGAYARNICVPPREPSGRLGEAPITQLPPELLLRIFHEMAHEFYYADSVNWVRVAQVCRQWRALVLGSPVLWSRITLRPNSSMRRVQQWIARSAQVLLSVEAQHYSSHTPTPSHTVQLYNAVLEELPRIRHLSLALPRDFFRYLDWSRLPAYHVKRLELLGQWDFRREGMVDTGSDACRNFRA